MSRLMLLLALLMSIFVQLRPASAATYAVGSCKPTLQSFPTISLAVAHVPPGSTLDICPGTYPEQVTITDSLNLVGVINGDADAPVITVPGGGLTQTTTVFGGSTPAVAQVLVQNPSAVNISNIAVDGTGAPNGCSGTWVIGIYYQSASGTINHVATRNHANCGNPIWVENDNTLPEAVTLENSSIHDFSSVGLTGFGENGPLSMSVLSNSIVASNSFSSGFAWGLSVFGSVTVSGNLIAGNGYGIFTCCGPGVTITKNTFLDNQWGVYSFSQDLTLTSNNFVRNGTAVYMDSDSNGLFQKNTISNGNVGFDLNCTASYNSITSNTFNDVVYGLNNVPISGSNSVTPNLFFNINVVKITC